MASLLFSSTAVADELDAERRIRKERSLPEGQLPAWETTAERAVRRRGNPRVVRVDELPLPPPPAPGYRAPAEFEPLGAFLVSQGDWGNYGMLVDMINGGTGEGGAGAIVLTDDTVAQFESVLEGQGVDLSRVRVLHPDEGLSAKWARDFGPISIYEDGVDGQLAFVDMHYYDTRWRDDAIPEFLADEIGIERYGLEGSDQDPADEARLYMEGGNYQTDGRGTCILSDDIPDDNDGNSDADSFAEVEQILAEYLGCVQVIWLTPPPQTGTGHVDMYAKLLTPTDMLMIDFPNSSGDNADADAVIEDNVAIMEAATNLDDQPFTIHRVVIPSLEDSWWGPTYHTYTNSVIVNRVALVPTYNEAQYDQDALDVYEDVLGPDYTVIGIPSSSIVDQGGAVHCTTMQISSGCGNGQLDDLLFEACEGDDLDGQDCDSLGVGPGGTLGCAEDCTFDLSGCAGGDSDTDSDSDSDSDSDTDSDTDSGGDADDADGGFDASPGTSGCGCSPAGAISTPSLFRLLELLG